MAEAGSKIAQIKKLRAAAASLRSGPSAFAEKFRDRSHYDKQGFGFAYARDTSSAFKMPPLYFEAYAGVYGSSSVSTQWSVDQDIINRFMAAALNTNKQAVFDTIAQLAEKEAAELIGGARTELDALEAMLADAAAVIGTAHGSAAA